MDAKFIGVIIVVIVGLVTELINLWSYLSKIKKFRKLENERKLSPNQIETHINQTQSNFIQLSSVVIVSIMMFATLYISVLSITTQINLANENIDYLKKTSSINWANLDMNFGRPNEERMIIDAKDLATPRKEVKDRVAISFVIINSGKVDSGRIDNVGYWKNNYIHTLINKDGQSINVSAQSGIKGVIYLMQIGCAIGAEEGCNPSEIPSKEIDLILETSCEFCEPESRITNWTIPLCIYHNNDEQSYCYKEYYHY